MAATRGNTAKIAHSYNLRSCTRINPQQATLTASNNTSISLPHRSPSRTQQRSDRPVGPSHLFYRAVSSESSLGEHPAVSAETLGASTVRTSSSPSASPPDRPVSPTVSTESLSFQSVARPSRSSLSGLPIVPLVEPRRNTRSIGELNCLQHPLPRWQLAPSPVTAQRSSHK